MKLLLVIAIIVTGWASQYAPGKMESVVAVRQAGRTAHDLPTILPPTDGYIAVLDCAHIGEIWHIEHAGIVESFLVVDCAGHTATRQWMTRNNILVEVDYETAVRWQTVGRGARIAIVEVTGNEQHTIN